MLAVRYQLAEGGRTGEAPARPRPSDPQDITLQEVMPLPGETFPPAARLHEAHNIEEIGSIWEGRSRRLTIGLSDLEPVTLPLFLVLQGFQTSAVYQIRWTIFSFASRATHRQPCRLTETTSCHRQATVPDLNPLVLVALVRCDRFVLRARTGHQLCIWAVGLHRAKYGIKSR